MADNILTRSDLHDHTIWLPPYTMRFSKKARKILLRISQSKGLEVVIPTHRKRYNIEQLLTEKQHWIKQHLPTILATQQYQQTLAKKLPNLINLNAIFETWKINYNTTLNCKPKIIASSTFALQYSGEIELKLITTVLKKWLCKYAKPIFAAKLNALCAQTQLQYQALQIRGQHTRWGSCNSIHNISLNFKLLFLPPLLVRYVLLHELCHTKHLNHSAKFWNLLAKFEPNYLLYKHELKHAEKYLPFWLLV